MEEIFLGKRQEARYYQSLVEISKRGEEEREDEEQGNNQKQLS